MNDSFWVFFLFLRNWYANVFCVVIVHKLLDCHFWLSLDNMQHWVPFVYLENIYDLVELRQHGFKDDVNCLHQWITKNIALWTLFASFPSIWFVKIRIAYKRQEFNAGISIVQQEEKKLNSAAMEHVVGKDAISFIPWICILSFYSLIDFYLWKGNVKDNY